MNLEKSPYVFQKIIKNVSTNAKSDFKTIHIYRFYSKRYRKSLGIIFEIINAKVYISKASLDINSNIINNDIEVTPDDVNKFAEMMLFCVTDFRKNNPAFFRFVYK